MVSGFGLILFRGNEIVDHEFEVNAPVSTTLFFLLDIFHVRRLTYYLDQNAQSGVPEFDEDERRQVVVLIQIWEEFHIETSLGVIFHRADVVNVSRVFAFALDLQKIFGIFLQFRDELEDFVYLDDDAGLPFRVSVIALQYALLLYLNHLIHPVTARLVRALGWIPHFFWSAIPEFSVFRGVLSCEVIDIRWGDAICLIWLEEVVEVALVSSDGVVILHVVRDHRFLDVGHWTETHPRVLGQNRISSR